jgi:hypothetical protein
MEYRGIAYTVVQTANPTGWKWTISIGKRMKTGTVFKRAAAIQCVEKVIDRHLKDGAKNELVEHRSKQTV